MIRLRHGLFALLAYGVGVSCGWSQEERASEEVALSASDAEDRIVTGEEVQEALKPPPLLIRVISYPHRVITRNIERALIRFEKGYLRDRPQPVDSPAAKSGLLPSVLKNIQQLRDAGLGGVFGGMGEQTGIGGGVTYTIRPTDRQQLQVLARGTLSRYQEYDVKWSAAPSAMRLTVEVSHQWRPKENFYGLGHGSLKSDHTDFGLSQSWAGAHFELAVPKHFVWGADYKLVTTKAVAGTNRTVRSTQDVFPDLPGLGARVRLHTTAAYIDADFSQGEYGWAGKLHVGASYQQGIAPNRLRYFNYEWRLEGRMPVVQEQSGLVGLFTLNLNHEKGGSDPIPFYMRPRIGGSSTLRGFELDRFYGKNLILMTVEYRYRIHPNFQTYIFHDAGQIFDQTADLNWFNWHRNYGLGLRLHSGYRTALRLEYGHSREGFNIHLSFGDRTPQPTSGAVRYGTYRK